LIKIYLAEYISEFAILKAFNNDGQTNNNITVKKSPIIIYLILFHADFTLLSSHLEKTNKNIA
jgi:hypothetical protein